MACLCLGPASLAVQPISGILASYDNLTYTNDNYSTTGGGSAGFPAGTTYAMRFNEGSQDNLSLSGFEIGANVYNFVLLADIINLERVDNSVCTGRHHIVLYEESSVAGTNVHLKSSYANTMELALRSPIVNRGADNVFANQGDGNGNNNNIQRIDYIFPDGFPVYNNVGERGFLIMDRGGNDRFKIAAITALDAGGKPSVFTDPVTVLETDWGDSGITLDTMVLRGYTEGGDRQHPSANVDPQTLAGVFVSWQDLGLQTNDFIYGYSLAANDATTNGLYWTNVSDTAYFPTNTSPDATYGGLDLISGGMMFFGDEMDVTIGDFVWDDWNGNGMQDAGEPGITNVLVYVYDADTNLAALTRTDSNGLWLAQGIGAGTFFVKFFLPTSYQFTIQNAGTNTAVNSKADPATGLTAPFAMLTGQSNLTVDAGMHLAPGDLRLGKSVNIAEASKGESVVYSLVITNAGAEPVGLAQVTDPLPAEVAFVSYGATAGTYTNATGVWNIGDLPVGASATLTVTGTVNSGFGGKYATNTATITRMNRPDTNTSDNVASAVFRIAAADLAVSKVVSDANPAEGQTVTFTVALTNNGPADVTGVELTDLLPSGLSFDGATPSQGSYNDGTGIWSVGSVVSGGVATLTVTADVDPGTAGDTVTNTAAVAVSSQDDPVPGNNSASASLTVEGADVGVLKTVDNAAPNEGATVTFTILLTNNGPSTATGVEISDLLPSGVTYSGHTPSQGAYDPVSGVWTVGAVNASGSATLELDATVNAGTIDTTITNTASVKTLDQVDFNTANNTSRSTIGVSGLRVTKQSDAGGSLSPGDTITYTIVVTNTGATTHTNVTVVDAVPAGSSYVAGSAEITLVPAWPDVQSSVVFNANSSFTVPAGVTSITVQAWGGGGGGGPGINRAGGGGGGGAYASAAVTVSPGSTYAVVVGGGGGANAAGGNSYFNAGAEVLARGGAAGGTAGGAGGSAATSIGTTRYSGGAGGARQGLNTAGGGGGGSATATASGGDGADGAGGIGGAGGTGEGPGGDGGNTGASGENGTAPGGGGGGQGRNGAAEGSGAAGRVIVSYALKGGSGFTNSPPGLASGWKLAPGSTLTVTFNVAVDNPCAETAISNTVSVTSDTQTVPVRSTVVDPLVSADLAVTKAVDDAVPAENDTITFTIVLTNKGPDAATGVALTDLLPSGVTYDSATPSQGSYNSVSGIWTVGTVAAYGNATLTLSATADAGTAGQTIVNTARVTNVNQADPTPGDNQDTASITVLAADLGIAKSVDQVAPIAGYEVTYTLVLTNNGPHAATGVEVTDALPAGVTYVDSTPSQGTYDPVSGVWTVGAVNVSATITLEIVVEIDPGTAGATITNTAAITASDVTDPVAANNEDDAVLTVAIPGISISKHTSATNALYFGDTITYTVTLTNFGNTIQSGISLGDVLPAGVTYVPGSSVITGPHTTNAVYLDRFGVRSYANSDGTAAWSTNWAESEGDGPTAGNIQILFDNVGAETYMLRFQAASLSMSRAADLGGATNATLSFDFRRDGLDDANDYVAVQASSSGTAGPWTELGRIAGAATDAAYGSTNYNLSAYIATNTAIRFLSSGTLAVGDIVWLDNVQVSSWMRVTNSLGGGAPPTLIGGLDLYTGEVITVTFGVTVDDPTTATQIVNTASVTTEQQTAVLYAGVTNETATADLVVGKTVNNPTPSLGATVDFTITVSNAGPKVAKRVKITDVLPTGLSYSNATPSQGAYSAASGIWTVGTLAVEGVASLIVRAVLTNDDAFAGVSITNWAILTDKQQIELETTNNSAYAIVTPKPTYVSLAWFRATPGSGGVVLDWETAMEVGTIGFYVHRRDPRTGAEELVRPDLLPGVLSGPRGGSYRLVDRGAQPGVPYTYRLEEVEASGSRNFFGPWGVTGQGGRRKLEGGGSDATDYTRAAHGPGREEKERSAQREEERQALRRQISWGNRLRIVVTNEGIYYLGAAEIAPLLNLPEAQVRDLVNRHDFRMVSRGREVRYFAAGGGRGLYFVGERANSLYTAENIYWLGLMKGTRPAVTDGGRTAAVPPLTFAETYHAEENRYATPAIYRDPDKDFWLWEWLVAGSPPFDSRSFTVQLDGASALGTAQVRVKLKGSSATGVPLEHHAVVKLNGVQVGEGRWTGLGETEIAGDVDPALLKDGSNGVVVEAVADTGAPYSVIYVDWIEVSCRRWYRAVDDELWAVATRYPVVTVRGFSASPVYVMDVTDPKSPVLLRNLAVGRTREYGHDVTYRPVTGRRYAVFGLNGVKRPARIEAAARPYLADAGIEADYLVITAPELRAAAEDLAAWREAQGYRTMVVDVQDVYDAFGWGLASPLAIRDFLRHAYLRWETAPEYVVLAGGGTFDYQDRLGFGDNLIPPKMVGTPFGLFESDTWMADVAGDDGVPEMAIGRLPALTSGELDVMAGKIEAYEQASGDWANRILFVADNADEAGNFPVDSDDVLSRVPGTFVKQRAYLNELGLAATRSTVLNGINQGCLLLNYIGHGALDRMAQEGIVVNADVAGMTNGEKLPVVLGFTCTVGRYGVPGDTCLGERFVLRNGGGAVALWAPTGLSMNDLAKVLADGFMLSRFTDGELVLGDIVRSAMEDYGGQGRPVYMLQIYNLLGDPAVPMR